ncbi:MAG: hypothetical protein ABJ333_12840 [Algoriphagus sp.]|uniref:hypothetical protein n=1 Tax=Algoriphagus sp. TaxID=1872435 RepID=UPI00329909B5
MESSTEKSESVELESNELIDLSELMKPLVGVISSASILRIEEIKYHGWKGVRSCGDAKRVKNEVNYAMEDLAKTKIYENRHLRYIRYGHLGGSYVISNSGGGIEPRKCRGNLELKCFIEFQTT